MPSGQLVAVKRSQQGSLQGSLEFRTEIELLSRVHHKNVVSLVGFCLDQGEQMLVYEYVANGTLKESLTGMSGVRLDWRRRLRVLLGAAKGIAYLHELADPPIVHRDIKSSNVLLDDRLNAKVSDFGLSKPLPEHGRGDQQVTTQVKGTMVTARSSLACSSILTVTATPGSSSLYICTVGCMQGYLDPEYYMTQQLTEKSDVYSFGVLMLEVITARKPLERGRYIVREVKAALDRTKDLYGLHELLDPVLVATSPSGIAGLELFVDLALRCVEEAGADRPSMGEAVGEIERILKAATGTGAADSASNSTSLYNSRTPRHPYAGDSLSDYSAGGMPSTRVEAK
jgi:serine/threonine protein kinase